jgi:DNA-binding NtrC family response regulator
MAYSWPGNVRELRNVIERAALISRSSSICAEDLPARMTQARDAPKTGLAEPPAPPPARSLETAALPPPGDTSLELRSRMQQYEAQLIRETLINSHWRRAVAARRLGMPLRTLAYKIKMFGIKKDSP